MQVASLAQEFSEGLSSCVAAAFSKLVPRWQAKQSVQMAEYLGGLLGPAAIMEQCWQKVVAGWQ